MLLIRTDGERDGKEKGKRRRSEREEVGERGGRGGRERVGGRDREVTIKGVV